MNIYSIKLSLLITARYFERNKRWLGLIILVSVVLIFAQVKFDLFYSSNTLRLGMVGTYQEDDLPDAVARLLSQSLVYPDESLRIQPNLVSGWEVNNDATNFKFKLIGGIFWADGAAISAQDLEFSIPGAEVTTLDESTIQFKLKESYSPLPSLLTKPLLKKATLLGTGPYQVTKIEKSRIFITKITLEPVKKDLPIITFRFYPNEKVAQTGFNLGEVEALLGIPSPQEVLQNPQANLRQKTDFGKIVMVFFNTKDPLLSNRSTRQALSYQAPQIEDHEVARGPLPKSSWAYIEDKIYLSHPTEAEAALERAKSSLGSDTFKKELTLTTTPNLFDVAQKVVNAWTSLGFDVKLRVESGIPQNFQALLITQTIPEDPDQYFLWHSSQEKTNLSKYSSARADKDLEDARKLIPEEDRKSKYDDFQKTLMEDAPATFLYFPKYNVVYLKKVEHLLDQVLNLK